MTTVSSTYQRFPTRAVAAGAAAGFGGIAIWVLLAGVAGEERSFAAVLIGLLVGYAARTVAKPLWWQVQVVSVAITIPALFVGQYLAVRQHVMSDLAATGNPSAVPLLLDPMSTATVVFSWLGLYPFDLLLWVIGIAVAWLVPLSRP